MCKKNHSRAAVVMAVALASIGLALAAGHSGVINGVVKDASGKPVAGVSVKAKNIDKGILFLVVSQEQGRYHIENLPPGKYTLQALGGGMQSDAGANAPVELGDAQTRTADLSLTARQSLLEMTTAQYAAMMPEGEAKSIILAKCTECHGLENIVEDREPAEQWVETIEFMRDNPFGMGSVKITDQQRDMLAEYFAEHWGPDVPMPETERTVPKTWLEGPAAQYTAVEFEIPDEAYVNDMAVDSKGIAWLSEQYEGNLGRLDPDSMTYSRIPLPPHQSESFFLSAIAVDDRDRVWVMDGKSNDRLIQYNPQSGELSTYTVPKPSYGDTHATTIRFHPNGAVWMTDATSDRILSFEPGTGKFRVFPIPSGKTSRPYGLAMDANDKVWFTENLGGRVTKLDPATGKFSAYAVPTPDPLRSLATETGGGEIVHNLRRMAADAEGNLWYGGLGLGKLGMIDSRTAKITTFDPPTPHSGPFSVDVDKSRNRIWFSEFYADQIARFDPRTKQFVEYPLPTKRSAVEGIEVDRSRPNRVWFENSNWGTVGYLEVFE